MRDPRFLPVEMHEPMEEEDFLEAEDAYESLIEEKGVKKHSLYVAS